MPCLQEALHSMTAGPVPGLVEAWPRLHEEEERLADAVDGRAERLKREKVQAHREAQYWKAQWGRARNALEAARAEAKDLRRVSKDTLHLRSEVDRLERLLAAIGVDTRKRSTMASLRIENGRLQAGSEALGKQLQEVESERDDLRSRVETLSRAQFGRKSERGHKGTGRKTGPDDKGKTGKRGPRPGGETHGRTPRPELAREREVHDPPPEALLCPCCNAPRVANGSHTSDLIEVEVKAHVRVIDRSRWRKTCQCSDTPEEVSAPPVPRLFPGTAYGISVWTRLLFELCVANRPLRRVAAWFGAQGLPVSPGTLSDGHDRIVALSAAILAHLQQAPVVHADETSWRVREFATTGSSSRTWLWIATCVDAVYLHVDASRSAAAAATLLGRLRKGAVLVCDRYSACKKLARLARGQLVLSFCWAPVRRDFIKVAAARGDLEDWKDQWLARIRRLYRLNAQRLRYHDPGRPSGRRRYLRMHFRLSRVLGEVFTEAERELATVDDASPQAKVLRSLLNHREGLSQVLDDPRIPLDNNLSEHRFRPEVIRRKLSLGSDNKEGAQGMAKMLSVVRTLEANDIAGQPWLEAWLSACAANGGHPPEDLGPWLPWTMDEARRAEFRA